MKLFVHIPTEKVAIGAGHTFTSKLVEAEVVRIVRSPARHDKGCHPWRVTGWYYSADIAKRPDVSPEAYHGTHDGLYRAHINRALNPKWKPPAFPEGKNWVNV